MKKRILITSSIASLLLCGCITNNKKEYSKATAFYLRKLFQFIVFYGVFICAAISGFMHFVIKSGILNPEIRQQQLFIRAFAHVYGRIWIFYHFILPESLRINSKYMRVVQICSCFCYYNIVLFLNRYSTI